MYDLINRLIKVTNKDKTQREEQVMFEVHEDYDEYLHEKDLFVLDHLVNVLKIEFIFFSTQVEANGRKKRHLSTNMFVCWY
jgi:hypothetical protein